MAKLGNLYSDKDMKGFSSFEADSLPSFDEFDDESVVMSYFKERWISKGSGSIPCVCPCRVCVTPPQFNNTLGPICAVSY